MKHRAWYAALLLILAAALPAAAQVAEVNEQTALGNKPGRFGRLGFGLFVHWSVAPN